MLSETPRKTRQIIAIVMVVFALVTIFAEPLMVKQILPPIIAGQQARYDKMSVSDVKEDQVKAEMIKDTPFLVSFFYPFWMALGVFGCIVVLAIAKAYVEGKQWARGLALLCFSFVAMGGAYMLVPAINFTGFGPYVIMAMIIGVLGLVPYFTILLGEKLKGKLWGALLFLFLGIQGAHSFANGHASLRVQWMHPARPLWPEGTWVLWLGTQVMWMGTLCIIAAIYFLGVRKKAGYYLALIGGVTTAFANFWVHFVRGTTSDYILGGSLGLIIVVLVLLPVVNKTLFDQEPA
ncbi:hypothetical protein ACFLXB_01520 [Chloroflexota bacterium]